MSGGLLIYVGHALESPKAKQCCLSLASEHLHVDKEVLAIISSGKDDDDQCANEERLGSYWAEALRKSVFAWKMKHSSSYIVLLARWGKSMSLAFTISLIVPSREKAILHTQVAAPWLTSPITACKNKHIDILFLSTVEKKLILFTFEYLSELKLMPLQFPQRSS